MPEYYPNKQFSSQVSEDLSRVSGCADTGLVIDISGGDTSKFADRLMNENENKEVLKPFNNIVKVIGG
jgi:hypothetical protein